MIISNYSLTNAPLEVVPSGGDLILRDKDNTFALLLKLDEARNIVAKLSAALDAVEPQKVAA